MKKKANLMWVVAVCLAVVSQAAERVETQTWAVGDRPILTLDTFSGSITVEAGEPGQISLELVATANDANAEKWLKSVAVKGQPFGAGLAVKVARTVPGMELAVKELPQREVRLTLRVPATCNLNLSTRSGSVEIGNDFQGNMHCKTQVGDVFVGRIDGAVSAETVRGSITVARTTGDLKAKTGIGDVTVGTILGRAELQATNGSIAVMSAQGDLNAEAVRGDVAAGFGREIPQRVSLRAGVGSVNVALDPQAAVHVDAKASWGRVHSKIALDNTLRGGNGKRLLEGALNGGGPKLALRASGGDINIDSVPSYEDVLF